ncbi:EamA family transporter [Arcticibacter sp. MXS-1]|uniref:EamA family transporter n=1 Tax=Arcticibacter sp. MXS-1 TaxID=3341726 RepID=UPI0035A86A50
MSATKSSHAPALLVILAFATVYVVWGSTYFFIQKAVAHLPPFLMGAMRFLTAGVLLLAWCGAKKEKLFEPAQLKTAAVTGFLLLFIGNGAVIWVEQFMPSAMVAIMVSSSPVWFVLLDVPRWKENLTNVSTLTGLFSGFLGVVLLFWEQISNSIHVTSQAPKMLGLALLVLASAAWSGGSLYSKYNSKGGSATVSTAWQMIMAGIFFVPCSILTGESRHVTLSEVPAEGWLALIYLILMGSIAAYSAYVWLLQVRPATQVSTYAYVNPVIAVLLGVFFANEKVSYLQVIGLIIILGSVLLINLAKYKKAKSLN